VLCIEILKGDSFNVLGTIDLLLELFWSSQKEKIKKSEKTGKEQRDSALPGVVY